MSSNLFHFEQIPLHERVSRRARNIRIDVRPSGDVVLTIPRGTSQAEARSFLARNREWVERTRARLMATATRQAQRVLRWDGSDVIPLLGKQMRVEPAAAMLRKPVMSVDAERICLFVPGSRLTDTTFLHRLLLKSLREQAHRQALNLLDEESLRLGLSYKSVSIRDQSSRWGSCSRDGRVSLNWRLVMAPPEVFRYVVVHELCHMRWQSHGPRFWGLVARQMPGHEIQRAWLRRHGDELQAWPPRLP